MANYTYSANIMRMRYDYLPRLGWTNVYAAWRQGE